MKHTRGIAGLICLSLLFGTGTSSVDGICFAPIASQHSALSSESFDPFCKQAVVPYLLYAAQLPRALGEAAKSFGHFWNRSPLAKPATAGVLVIALSALSGHGENRFRLWGFTWLAAGTWMLWMHESIVRHRSNETVSYATAVRPSLDQIPVPGFLGPTINSKKADPSTHREELSNLLTQIGDGAWQFLPKREEKVVRLILQGMENKEIAQQLRIPFFMVERYSLKAMGRWRDVLSKKTIAPSHIQVGKRATTLRSYLARIGEEKALKMIPEGFRKTVLLKTQDKSDHEIATLQGKSDQTVVNQVTKSIKIWEAYLQHAAQNPASPEIKERVLIKELSQALLLLKEFLDVYLEGEVRPGGLLRRLQRLNKSWKSASPKLVPTLDSVTVIRVLQPSVKKAVKDNDWDWLIEKTGQGTRQARYQLGRMIAALKKVASDGVLPRRKNGIIDLRTLYWQGRNLRNNPSLILNPNEKSITVSA